MITTGDGVRLRASGAEYRVGTVLGAGSQGMVFEAAPVAGGGTVALKWYRDDAATRSQARRLERILSAGRPSEAFLWPLDLAARSTSAGFGYIMPKRREGFVPLSQVMNSRQPMSLRRTTTAAARLADAFLRLHALGLCYADVSLNNVFIAPETGEIQICDNDNVMVDGDASDVLGTPYFMAPEVVRGESAPGTATDRYSLAVILFCMLTRHHPLFGAKETAEEVLDAASLARLLGTEPVFVFDPDDVSNRPVPQLHDNALLLWPTLPLFVQRMFVQAFTVGLRDPMHGRVTESEWRGVMHRLRGLVRHCPVCGTEQFWDPEALAGRCAAPDCGAALPEPIRLVAHHPVLLEPGLVIAEDDLLATVAAQDRMLADVVTQPSTGALALRNRSATPWVLHRPESEGTVPPRAAVVVKPTTTLRIGSSTVRFEG